MRRIIIAVAFIVAYISAKPMPNFPVKVYQGGLDTIYVYNRGDEFGHYTETIDGYLLLQNTDGFFYYADSNANISNVRATANRSDKTIKFLNSIDKDNVKNLYINKKMPKRERKNYGNFKKSVDKKGNVIYKPSAGNWTKGKQTFLMILVNHNARQWTSTEAKNFERMLNEKGYSDSEHFGSVRDYYIKQSGGAFEPTFKVLGPYTYNGMPSGNDAQVMQAVLNEAYSKGDLKSFNGYANNYEGWSNNTGTFVGLVLAGNTNDYGMSGTIYMGWMNTIHKQGLVGRYVYIPGMSDGDNTLVDGMGTFAHEFGHVLGLPDLYQTETPNGTKRTPGNWDVMDVGCYNNYAMDGRVWGTHVPNMSSLEREWLGWHTPTDLPNTNGVYALPSYDAQNFAYQIVDSDDKDQWFVLENRQQSAWDESLPNHGLLIWHIDYSQSIWDTEGVNNNNQYVDIEEANTSSNAYYSFPGIANVTSFDGFTNWNNKKIYNKISNITESNGYICFGVGGASVTECPPNQIASSSSSEISSSSKTSSSSSAFSFALASYVYNLHVNVPITQNYERTELSFDANVITENTGISKADLSKNASYFVLENSGNIVNAPNTDELGNWYDNVGNVVDWGENAAVFCDVDLETFKFNIGSYPGNVTNNQTIKIMPVLSVGNKSVLFNINIEMQTIESSSSVELVSPESSSSIDIVLPESSSSENTTTLASVKNMQQVNVTFLNKNLFVTGASEVHVFDIRGKLLLTKNVHGAISLANMPSGHYIVQIVTENKNLIRQLVIK